MNHNNGLLEGRNISYGIIKLFFSTKAKKNLLGKKTIYRKRSLPMKIDGFLLL
jgi:hypothetical protein